MHKLLGLKIDVDTYEGMKTGVPSLLRVLHQFQVKGTFFLSIGPDASGRAALNLLRNPRFLKKMVRSNAVGLYGLKTALYGTLLPSPLIALSFPNIVREIVSCGHEVQFHAWDHRRWQDDLHKHSASWIREWFERGVDGFQQLTGHAPSSFGAPAWLIDDRVMEIVREYSFDYLSCTRAKAPFIHEDCRIVEIPSDLPCPEEFGTAHFIDIITDLLEDGGIHVLPVHAEVEGGIRQGVFMELMKKVMDMGYGIVPLQRINDALTRETLPLRKYQLSTLPGRSVPCAV